MLASSYSNPTHANKKPTSNGGAWGRGCAAAFQPSPIQTITVGSGFAPDQPASKPNLGWARTWGRGLGLHWPYRRSGISPCPEGIYAIVDVASCAQARTATVHIISSQIGRVKRLSCGNSPRRQGRIAIRPNKYAVHIRPCMSPDKQPMIVH